GDRLGSATSQQRLLLLARRLLLPLSERLLVTGAAGLLLLRSVRSEPRRRSPAKSWQLSLEGQCRGRCRCGCGLRVFETDAEEVQYAPCAIARQAAELCHSLRHILRRHAAIRRAP